MDAKLHVYSIVQCGYYGYGENQPAFCALADCLTTVHDWIHNSRPRISSTKTFNEADDGTQMPVYCFDIARHGNGEFLLTTWNETPSENGAIGAVSRTDRAGNAGVHGVDLPEDSIPGYGTHFWFLPSQSRVVTVRFPSQSLNGHLGMNAFVRGYLERFSPHVRFAEQNGSSDILLREILGYVEDSDATDGDDRLTPRFRSSPMKRGGEMAYIRRNQPKIKKVIRKGRTTEGGAATRSLLDRVLTSVGARPNNRALPDTNFLFEIPYTPTATELSEIISRWETNEREEWDDIGFDFSGDPTRRWLSSSSYKVEVDLPNDLHDGPNSLAPAGPLLEALGEFRRHVSA